MRSPRSWVLFGSLGFLFFHACASFVQSAQVGEWTLKVKAERADIRLKPEPASPVVTTLPKGTVVTSWAKSGGWFRVLVEPGREGHLTFGYLAPRDVDVRETAQGMPDYWPEVPLEYGGAGISVRLGGGFFFFPGGDIERGMSGMFERTAAMISALGDTIEEKRLSPLHSGYDLAGDIIYRLGRKIGIGLRGDYLYTSVQNLVWFSPPSGNAYYTGSETDISVISLSPELNYQLPISRLLAFSADAGPVICFTDFNYDTQFFRMDVEEDFHQRAKATSFGFQGGAGLELRLNPRSSVFLEVRGRYARITNLKGEEQLYHWEESPNQPGAGEGVLTTVKGYLYYGQSGGYPGLAVHENDSAAGGGRRAVLDLSGVSLALGFKLMF